MSQGKFNSLSYPFTAGGVLLFIVIILGVYGLRHSDEGADTDLMYNLLPAYK